MYDKSSVIANLIDEARVIVAKNREQYDPLMIIIENFIYNNDIIVNDSQDYHYDLYTTDMYTLPRQLTDELYQSNNILAKYATMTITIVKYSALVSINNIGFVTFTYINSEIRKNILPYKCLGVYIPKQYKCFGPEITLINIYTQLVNPKYIDKWENLYKQERELSKEIIITLKNRIHEGGKEVISDSNIEILLRDFVTKDHVIIGQIGTMMYTGKATLDNISRLQIISQNQIRKDIEVLQSLFERVRYSNNHLKIPTNLNLYKTKINIDDDISLDIYNAGTFEVIPFNYFTEFGIELQIGTPFVIKRFRLIDIWSTLYLSQVGIITQESMKNIIRILILEYANISKLNIDINLLFSSNYIGFYEDQTLKEKRLKAKLKTKYIPPYIPCLKQL